MAMTTVFTNQGKAVTANRVKGLGSEPNYVGWGTGAGVASASDTGLFTESAEPRVAGTSSVQTTNVPNDTYQVQATMVAAQAETITNVALVDAPVAGNCFLHSSFDGVPLQLGDAIQFTLKVVYQAA